jgi:hypothetical protein
MRFEDGQKLIDAVVESGVEVTAAFWAKEMDDFRWYLNLVLPIVAQGPKAGYGRVLPVIRQLQAEGLRIDLFEVKVHSPLSPVAEAVAKLRGDHPGMTQAIWTLLGDVAVEGIYIYPAEATAKAK